MIMCMDVIKACNKEMEKWLLDKETSKKHVLQYMNGSEKQVSLNFKKYFFTPLYIGN